MSETFGSRVRASLAELDSKTKKKCCRKTAQMLSELTDISSDAIRGIFTKCLCDGCRAVFLRGIFERCGSVTTPEKAYHLDMSFDSEAVRNEVGDAAEECGIMFRRGKRSLRQGVKYLLYLKNSSEIADFLLYIGAQNEAFDFMNSQIVHQINNTVNRQINCDTANIRKQLEASKKDCDAIEWLEQNGMLDNLPEELKETAKLRFENSQLSLENLGRMLTPTVSKSGIRHRLEKICELAEKLKSETGCQTDTDNK